MSEILPQLTGELVDISFVDYWKNEVLDSTRNKILAHEITGFTDEKLASLRFMGSLFELS